VKKRLTEELLQARAQVHSILESLKVERTLIKAKEAKQGLADIEERARTSLVPPSETISIEQLGAGDHVEIVSLGASGILLESPQGKKRVRVRVGDADMSVAVSLLIGRIGKAASHEPGRTAGRLPPPERRTALLSVSESETAAMIDVRGKTAEEAVEAAIIALDRAALAGRPLVRIIHGHGTGKLKAALRSYLAESPYVASFRAGERAEGGDGVTIVELK
jgi:DNA mismatch repair protein MutS2